MAGDRTGAGRSARTEMSALGHHRSSAHLDVDLLEDPLPGPARHDLPATARATGSLVTVGFLGARAQLVTRSEDLRWSTGSFIGAGRTWSRSSPGSCRTVPPAASLSNLLWAVLSLPGLLVLLRLGAKYCPGSHLARQQLIAALDVLLEGLPGLHLRDAAPRSGSVLRATNRVVAG